MTKTNPKVFISLASEDKTRFVENFAYKLITKGIDPWTYFWEILPGDSLIDKIFIEGISKAKAVIIIISKFSIIKPWVREEINAAFVRKVENEIKLIPVIIDECNIPECLKHTAWVKIKDLNNYEEEFNSIVASIFNYPIKPQLGDAPGYVNSFESVIPSLTKIDSIILKACGDLSIKEGYPLVDVNDLFSLVKDFDIDKKNLEESVNVLERRNYLTVHWSIGRNFNFSAVGPTLFGFEEYCKIFIENYDQNILDVGFWLVNNGESYTKRISEELNLPILLVNHILHLFEGSNFLEINEYTSNVTYVSNISPDLKRHLEGNI